VVHYTAAVEVGKSRAATKKTFVSLQGNLRNSHWTFRDNPFSEDRSSTTFLSANAA